jgi:hypothetical protein
VPGDWTTNFFVARGLGCKQLALCSDLGSLLFSDGKPPTNVNITHL